ncbi:nucleotide exchange factor GrpE [Proteinivorax tanatarense]|uniref:Protein GrpE n=1 Tax=Proteinivorax tanatarense TaxID=1260629 RepID=A0AAU7VI75_9FIRM
MSTKSVESNDEELKDEEQQQTDSKKGNEEKRQEQQNDQNLEQDVKSLNNELENQKEKNNELLGQLARLQADFDNFRKRTAKEKRELTKNANADLILNLLPVLDNFELALQNQQDDGFRKGVEMILKQFIDILKKEGLQEIEALNKLFDPTLHEAVMQEEKHDVEKDVVIEVMRKGYLLNDKLLRPSMVKVSK